MTFSKLFCKISVWGLQKKTFSSWFNSCYSVIWRWHNCTIHVIVHLTIGLNKVIPLTQYFCFVLYVQGKSAKKLLVEDKLSNLTLASADDKLCYWTFGLFNFRLFMPAQLSLKFFTFRFLDFVITAWMLFSIYLK